MQIGKRNRKAFDELILVQLRRRLLVLRIVHI
jgi:hypothetical protein